jgi:hypothetical protein
MRLFNREIKPSSFSILVTADKITSIYKDALGEIVISYNVFGNIVMHCYLDNIYCPFLTVKPHEFENLQEKEIEFLIVQRYLLMNKAFSDECNNKVIGFFKENFPEIFFM